MKETDDIKRNYHRSRESEDQKLSDMQERFVLEYLKDLNATKAYKRAGYKASGKNVSAIAGALRNKPYIDKAIAKAMKDRESRTLVTVDKVVQELAKLAFSNLADYFSRWDDTGAWLKASNELTSEQTACLESIETTDTPFGIKLKVKLYSKPNALQLLGEHLGMWGKKEPNKEDPEEFAKKSQAALRKMKQSVGGR
jgi:phage terminase small subunit